MVLIRLQSAAAETNRIFVHHLTDAPQNYFSHVQRRARVAHSPVASHRGRIIPPLVYVDHHFRFDDGRFQAIAAVGALNPKEFADPRATTAKMAPVAEATRGGVRWLKDGMPDFRRVSPDRPAEGRGWLGMVAHGDYLVTGIRRIGLMPGLAVLALALATLMLAWRREGR